jgi:hypothetical protein
MFRTKVVEKKISNSHLYSVTFQENRAALEIMWGRRGTPGQTAVVSMAHALCMVDKYGDKHTLAICDTYCFSTATVGTRTRFIVT